MSVKIHKKDSFDIIKSTVDHAVDMIKPTYGPASNKVIISKFTHKLIVDDGVQIARDLELEDPSEQAVWMAAKEVAIRTTDRVGDGTTGSLIMLQAIINAVASRPSLDGRSIELELKKGLEEAKDQLLGSVKKIKTKEDLRKVSRISFDDQKISEVIADTWFKLGPTGVVTVDRSGTLDTFAEVTEGVTIERGYISPYMITNPQRMEGLIEKPYILLTDYRLTETADILPIMNKLAEKQIVNLVVICENMENSALATAIVNRVQNKFNLIAINLPQGENKTGWLEDLGIMIGAKVFSEKKGDKLEKAEIADLGRAERFISRRTESVIIGPRGKKTEVNKAIADLSAVLNTTPEEKIKKDAETRLAFFSGKVAVIKVGGSTESEERALRYKVEDAINAVQAAFKGGVVCGSGLALHRLETSSEILNEALKAPFKQLKLNMGIETHKELKADEAINAVSGKIGKYMEIGVIDPVDVLIAGIESAVSIASLLITTSGIIVEVPDKNKDNQQG